MAIRRCICGCKFYSWVLFIVEMHRMVQCCSILHCSTAFKAFTRFVGCSNSSIAIFWVYVDLLTYCISLISVCDRVLDSENWHKESSTSFLRSLAIDWERMMPVEEFPRVGLSALNSFSVLTLLVGWQEGHLASKNMLCRLPQTCTIYNQRFCLELLEVENQ